MWTLNWVRGEGAETCVSGHELELKLQKALAEAHVAVTPPVIEGIITRDAGGAQFRVRLRVLDASQATLGLRELTSGDARCESLTPSIVLVLAMLIELASDNAVPERVEAAPAAQAEAPATPAAPELPPALIAKKPTAPTASAPRAPIDLDAAFAFALGLTPEVSVGPMLSLRVRTPWLIAFALRAGYWPGGRTRIVDSDAQSASVDFHAFESDLSLCLPLPADKPWWIAGCWGVALLLRKASISGLQSAPDSLRFSAGAHAALQFGYALSQRLVFSFEASLLGFRRRDSYTYDDVHGDVQEVFRQSHFAGTFAMGLGVRL